VIHAQCCVLFVWSIDCRPVWRGLWCSVVFLVLRFLPVLCWSRCVGGAVLWFSFRCVVSRTVAVFGLGFRPFSLVADGGLGPERFSVEFLAF